MIVQGLPCLGEARARGDDFEGLFLASQLQPLELFLAALGLSDELNCGDQNRDDGGCSGYIRKNAENALSVPGCTAQ